MLYRAAAMEPNWWQLRAANYTQATMAERAGQSEMAPVDFGAAWQATAMEPNWSLLFAADKFTPATTAEFLGPQETPTDIGAT